MIFLYILIGIMLLALGRKLFWLFVGSVGFVAGVQIAQQHLFLAPSWQLWTIGVICGLLGALLALFFQKVAIIVGGFAAGCAIAVQLTVMLGFTANPLVTICGGILGAIVLYLLFDWALIALSSVAGATLIVHSINPAGWLAVLLYVVLILAGIVFQSLVLRPQKPKGA